MNELIDKQALIDKLNQMIEHGVSDKKGQYLLSVEMIKDVVENMPTAEPHTFTVIDTKTGEEADTYKIALKEEWAKGLCYCDMEGFAIEEDGTLILLDECGRCAYCPQGRFEVIWDG